MSRGDEDKPQKPKYGGKIHGPKVEGAQARPIVGKAREPHEVKKPKYTRRGTKQGPAKDEVEKAERYTRGQQGVGGISAHAEKVLRAQELKRLIGPLTPSLVQVMSDIAHDKKVHPAVRLDAADRLITRLHGKPTEHIAFEDPNESADPDEVKTLLNNILASVGAPLLEFHDDETEPTPPADEEEDDA